MDFKQYKGSQSDFHSPCFIQKNSNRWWFCLIPKVEHIKQQKTSNRRAFIPKLQFSFIWFPFINDPGRERFSQAKLFQGSI
ncbi:hypothetical protein PGTUg99_034495 [Puccinia graminis f. sp. tritici]|uniref:Uncharacterized protein n=1 Tax=Puccinia graminis f. sp. tritici TaxID=56615 RepID=A0A5B0LVC0_PUCGR|nr:hypothetical protein PGTUg99_034495 [Puccinia graminis f. sp. tritici]